MTISPSIFQSSLSHILDEVFSRRVMVYADDILIHSKGTEKEHKELAVKGVKLLEDAQAQIKLAKCLIAVKTITFLGLTLDDIGLKIHDKFL